MHESKINLSLASKLKALDLIPHLIDAATDGRTMTYQELGAKVGSHQRPIPLRLGYIRDELCVKYGLPMISAIVVNKDTGLPGYSFLPGGTDDLTRREYTEAAERVQSEVFDFMGWARLLDIANSERKRLES